MKQETNHKLSGRDHLNGKRVVLKGEIHSSSGDNREEKSIIREGIDALVLEGPGDRANYSLTETWYEQVYKGAFYLLSPLYQPKQVLTELAKAQDANIHRTRKNDAEILRKAPTPVRILSGTLYFLMLITSLSVGLYTQKYVFGATFLAFAFLTPLLVLRLWNMASDGRNNRDRIIAQKISQAARENDEILAIVGDGHTDGIKKHLKGKVDIEYHPPEYSRFSVPHLKDILVPTFRTFSLLLTLYLSILWISMNVISVA